MIARMSAQLVLLLILVAPSSVAARTATDEPTPRITPGFVAVRGDQLVQEGQPITLKGVNYYPAAHPWSLMWTQWNGPLVKRDLGRARRELGINTVRILVPYRRIEGWTDDRGNVDPAMLARLREFISIAGRHQLKTIVTLFDWQDGSAPTGSQQEIYDLAYLRAIVTAFRDDDRVLAWDLHNEPDHYPSWREGRQAAAVDWLDRMAAALRAIDPHHPITVGVGKVETLWQPAPSGRTIADISDFISVHSYDAAAFGSLLAAVRERSAKPVLLEEFGWPSGPACRGPFFDERSQRYLFEQALDPANRAGLVGVLAWWLQDPPATLSFSEDENGYFGLYRRDGRPKPAAELFAALAVPPLPSHTRDQIVLTEAPVPSTPPREAPLVFPDGLVLREQFLHFWRFFGGEATFGRPLTLAQRDADGRLVQYFERARFQLNESEHVQPIDLDWREGQTPEVYLDRIHLAPLGAQRFAATPPVPDPQLRGVRYVPATGHTLRGAFRVLWERHGAIFWGPPLTEPFVERVEGRRVRVQIFEHWRFEQHPDGTVQLAPLGADALLSRACPTP